jgi:hypothetical protein
MLNMALGQRSLYQSLFTETEPAPVVDILTREKKGRSEVLKAKQNELIVCRYYYFIKVEERQYEKTLDLLANEIFLSKRTIIDIIAANNNLLGNLHRTKPDIKYFRNKYPHIVWLQKAN